MAASHARSHTADAPDPATAELPSRRRPSWKIPASASSSSSSSSVSAGPSPSPARSPAASSQPKFQVLSLINNAAPQVREYKRRKPHTKTKAGCIACKKKKVKCGLERPICLRCQRNQRNCVYQHGDDDAGRRVKLESPPARTVWARPSLPRPAAPNFRTLLAPAFPAPGPEMGTSPDELLHHFQLNWYGIFGMPNFTGSLMPMALRFDHVRSTLLAVAASHLRHRLPAVREHRLAEHFQQSLAIQSYQNALCTPLPTHGQAGTDALLMTAMLMNMLAFALPGEEDADPTREPDVALSWVFSPREDRLGWLAFQMGLGPLLRATQPWREQSYLSGLFMNSDDERRTLTGYWPSLSRVPETWTTVFGLERSAPTPGATRTGVSLADLTYRDVLRVLAEIRDMDGSPRNVLRYFQFLGKLEPEFRLLLAERDERAMWAFGMWLGLMCRFNGIWWSDRRVRRDFRAIRIWLDWIGVERRPGQEGRLWRELLRDLDDTWGFRYDRSLMLMKLV